MLLIIFMSREVSNITFVPFINYMKYKGLNYELLFEGTDADLRHVTKLSKRSSWELFNAMLNNIDKYIDDDWVYVSRQGVVAPELDKLRTIFTGLISSRFIYWAQSAFIGTYLFNNFTYTYKKIDRLNIEITINTGRPNVHYGIMHMYKQVFELFPWQLGEPNAEVVMSRVSDQDFKFSIKLANTINIAKRIKLFFSFHKGMRNTTSYLKELQDTKNELEEIKKEREQWLKVIAHDIKSPLSVINNYVKIYNKRKDLPKESIDKYFDRIEKSANTISACMANAEKVLDAEKSIELDVVNLKEIISEAVEIVQEMASNKNITIVERAEDAFILGDAQIISLSIFSNFLTNAIKFSPENSSIIIGTVNLDNEVAIYIRDHGIGIDAETLEYMNNGNSYTSLGTNNESGLGQGLVLARNFISKYKGRLEIKSATEKSENQGTTVTIHFPEIKQQSSSYVPAQVSPGL